MIQTALVHNGRPARLAVFILTVPLIAGCLGGTEADVGGMSAKDAHGLFIASGLAPKAPLPWHPEMVLVGVGAIETPDQDLPPNLDAPPLPLTVDPDVGDGRAPQWFLSYAEAATGDAVLVRVAGPDDITFHANHDPQMAATEHEVAAWTIDSPQAVTIARDEATFEHIVRHDDAVVSTILMPYAPDAAAWLVQVGTPGGDQETIVVHATTGRTMTFGDLIAAANQQSAQAHEFSGSLDATSPTSTHGYSQEGEGYDVYANLSYSGSGWPNEAHLDLVLWHNGYDISWETRHHDTGRTQYHWLDVGSGPYRLDVEPVETFPEGATVQYTLSVEIVPRG